MFIQKSIFNGQLNERNICLSEIWRSTFLCGFHRVELKLWICYVRQHKIPKGGKKTV
jgi:hypothetical protein